MQVVLCGQSYDATAALFTASMHHPAVKGVVALYPFWYDICFDHVATYAATLLRCDAYLVHSRAALGRAQVYEPVACLLLFEL